MDLQAANPAMLSCEKVMAEVLQTAEKAKPSSANDSAGGINLVDLGKPAAVPQIVRPHEVLSLPPVTPPTLHIDRPPLDADLNRKYVHLDPGAWNNDAALRNIYENGILKLHSDPTGRQQFGLRVSNPRNEYAPQVPIGRGNSGSKGLALEFRLRF